jgi:hypothetical protein
LVRDVRGESVENLSRKPTRRDLSKPAAVASYEPPSGTAGEQFETLPKDSIFEFQTGLGGALPPAAGVV